MNKFKAFSALGIVTALSFGAAFSADAHRSWILPSQAQVEGKSPWVTFDAASSDNLFEFDSFPLKLDGLTVTGPDGKPVAVDNPQTGHMRSTFDLQLAQQGTYKVSIVTDMVMARYTQGGEQKRFRGSEADFKASVPADARDLQVSRMSSRIETFVTDGKGNDTALAPAGKGLELVPLTHPSELVASEPARFRFLIDGKPAANLVVAVVPGGVHYRGTLKDWMATTDTNGEVSITWPFAGMYWLGANYPPRGATPQGDAGNGDHPSDHQGGDHPGGHGGGPDGPMPAQRLSYVATFDVLPN